MVTVRIDNLSARLDGHAVLHQLSARFNAGQMIGIIGPNGAGKTTLVRAILGLVTPDQGSVEIDGTDIAAMPLERRARTIAYLAQNETIHWPVTVERLVALGRLPHLAPLARIGPDDREAIARALDMTDMTSFGERIATSLSGGERARAMLARALAAEAPLLIADEPLAALDPAHQFDVMQILREQVTGHGRTVVAILHDLSLALRYCDHVLLLDQGRAVAEGPPQHVLSPEQIAEVYGISVAIVEQAGQQHIVPLAPR
ncbi:MAG: ABC transporter ATP-binding protein [Blastomonas sp.]